MLTFKKHGLKIPQDVAVAGFNDDPTATVIDPPLTTVIQPAFEMGVSAVEILLDQINGNVKSIVKNVHSTDLQIRLSSLKS